MDTQVLAAFIREVSYDQFSDETVEALQKRVLDSIGIGVNALGEAPVESVYETVQTVENDGPCTLWGREQSASPVQAAMHNTALTRYLDFMDSFLAPGETPHPSDNIAAVMACAEYADVDGATLLEGIGVTYETQAALAWNAPVRDRGFDHVTHTVISAACGCAKVLGLNQEQIRHAIGIAGTAHNALRVTRTEGINAWKGIASANAARNAVYACLLAKNGMEGPVNLFEGKKGWNQVIAGTDWEEDLDPTCPAVQQTMAKKYVAETYAQSAVEGIIELAEEHDINPEAVESIHLETFHGAKLIIGGGEGDRHVVETKAQADHSLPYMLAAALIDREMTNAQYEAYHIQQEDVQNLLQTVTVEEDPELTARFEDGDDARYPVGDMPANITIILESGEELRVEKDAFDGHPHNPASWHMIEDKFHRTASRFDADRRDAIQEVVEDLDSRDVRTLTALLSDMR